MVEIHRADRLTDLVRFGNQLCHKNIAATGDDAQVFQCCLLIGPSVLGVVGETSATCMTWLISESLQVGRSVCSVYHHH